VGQVSQTIFRSNSGNFIAQKWHPASRGEREELTVVWLHTLTKLLLMNQREKFGEVTLGGHRRFFFANKYEHLQSDCGMVPVTVLCAISSKHEFSIAGLEAYLLQYYISPTPTGFELYRYKSRALRKAGTWICIVLHEHFPAF